MSQCPECERNKFRAAMWRAEAYKQAGHDKIERPWVGLSINEAQDFYESKLSRAELINKIDEFLEEKNQ